ncbi:MAG: amidinotransferase [Rhizobiales bacterium]|nr:amidinotransferase [Hyphomicrobiales bacterium]
MARFGAYSEFGKLREVVVGSAQDLHLPPFGKDLSHYNDDLRKALVDNGNKPLDVSAAFPDLHKRTVEQIENVAATYKDAGIKVHRPRAFTHEERIHLGVLQEGWSQLYPADPVFVIGKHYMEISIRRAYRRKEAFPLREVVLPIVNADAEAHYVAMPQSAPWTPSGEGPGPFLEGGDLLINGQDVFVGQGELCSDQAGLDWLKRYLERWDYKVHPVPINGPILHALGIMCLLREGLLMAHMPALVEGLPEPLKNWDVIEITEDEMKGHATVGVSLDQQRYMIDPRFGRIMDLLHKHGIEPVPTQCDAIGYWGGAIRCITLPLARDPA